MWQIKKFAPNFPSVKMTKRTEVGEGTFVQLDKNIERYVVNTRYDRYKYFYFGLSIFGHSDGHLTQQNDSFSQKTLS